MFGILELNNRIAVIETTIVRETQVIERFAKHAKESAQHLEALVQQMARRGTETHEQMARVSLAVANAADETRTQIAQLAKMIVELVDRQSKLSEDLMEVDRKASKAVSFASQPVGDLTFERQEVTTNPAVVKKPKRSNTRAPWPMRFNQWCKDAPFSDVQLMNRTLKSYDPEGVQYNESLVKAAFAVGLCDWLRANDLENLPPAQHYTRSAGENPHKVTIPDLQNPKLEPVNFGCADVGKRMRAERQWTRLAKFVKAQLDKEQNHD